MMTRQDSCSHKGQAERLMNFVRCYFPSNNHQSYCKLPQDKKVLDTRKQQMKRDQNIHSLIAYVCIDKWLISEHIFVKLLVTQTFVRGTVVFFLTNQPCAKLLFLPTIATFISHMALVIAYLTLITAVFYLTYLDKNLSTCSITKRALKKGL